ncbi:MAG: KilA-N domain-containing protein [Akkermansiaceae bacterium]|nr:KilA-N domain-containing protein [Akkermansiaceae bacterium]
MPHLKPVLPTIANVPVRQEARFRRRGAGESQPQLASSACLNAKTGDLIPREIAGFVLQQRRSDGYWNATAMRQAVGKKLNNCTRTAEPQALMKELESVTRIGSTLLVMTKQYGVAHEQGTRVHPKVAYHLAQWCSPRFAVRVTHWIDELVNTGKVDLVAPSFDLKSCRALAVLSVRLTAELVRALALKP